MRRFRWNRHSWGQVWKVVSGESEFRFRRHFVLTLGMARKGQEEQTFLGSTKKKSWPSGQNEMVFRRLRPVFVASKASGSAVVSAGLALVSREYPWFFHGNTVRYDSSRARDYESIDRYRRRRLSTQSTSFMLGSPGFFLLPRNLEGWTGRRHGWTACSSEKAMW